MTVREFAMVACKILGLYFMLIALAGFGKGCFSLIANMASLSEMASRGGIGCRQLGPMFSALISPLIELGIGFYVWSQADAIAERIIRDDS
jgi:hypothetical protein